MGEVIGLEHVRRSKRLFRILIDRYGLHYFLATSGNPHPLALDDRRFDQAVSLASIWMEMQTKTHPSDPTVSIMRRDLKRILIHRIAEDLVQAGW
jgi:hypothetical protein